MNAAAVEAPCGSHQVFATKKYVLKNVISQIIARRASPIYQTSEGRGNRSDKRESKINLRIARKSITAIRDRRKPQREALTTNATEYAIEHKRVQALRYKISRLCPKNLTVAAMDCLTPGYGRTSALPADLTTLPECI